MKTARSNTGFIISPLSAALFTALMSTTAFASESSSKKEVNNTESESVNTQDIERIYVTASTLGSYSDAATKSATKMVLSLRETPQSVSVITAQQLEDWKSHSIRDMLNTATGFHTSNRGSHDRPTFFIRGGEVNLIQIDGVEQFSGGRRPDVSGDSVAYERIEIIRGANGLMTGVGDPTATVNLVRKRAISKEFVGNLGITSGRWDHNRVEVDISSPLNNEGSVRGRVAAAYFDKDSFVDRYGQQKLSVYTTVEADITDNTLARAGLEYADTVSKGVINTHAAPYYFSDGSLTNFGRNRTGLAANWSSWPLTERTLFAGITHGFDNGWQIHAIATQNEIDMQGGEIFFLWNRDFYNPDGSTTTENGHGASSAIHSSTDKQMTFDINIQGGVELFGREHDVIVGYNSFDRERTTYGREFDLQGMPMDTNYFDWTGDVPRYPFKKLGKERVTDNKNQGVFAATRLNLSDELKVIVGLRRSHWEIETSTYNAQTGEFKATFGDYEVKGETTPYAGILYDFNDDLTAYVSYADVFKPQEAYDRYDNILDPIVGANYEIGLKGESGLLNYSIALFKTEQDNLAEVVPDFDPNNPDHLTPNGNVPKQATGKGNTVNGFELEVSGEVYKGWNIASGYSYAKPEDDDGKHISTNVPVKMFKLFTTYQLHGSLDNLVVGAGVNWQSDFWVDSNKPTGQFAENGFVITEPEKRSHGSYALFNLMARYSVNEQLDISLNINNLFDKHYNNAISTWNGGVTWGAPRNVMLSARYTF